MALYGEANYAQAIYGLNVGSMYSATQESTVDSHALKSTLASTRSSWLSTYADTIAEDAAAAALASNGNLAEVIQFHAEHFRFSGDDTWRGHAINAAVEFATEWPRGLSEDDIMNKLPRAYASILAHACSLDPALIVALKPIFDTILTSLFDGTFSQQSLGGYLGIRVEICDVLNNGVSALDDYGDNVGLDTMLVADAGGQYQAGDYFHISGYPYWFKGSTYYVTTNVPYWLIQAGAKVYDTMTTAQKALYDAATRIAIALTWHGISLYVGEDIDGFPGNENGNGEDHAEFPMVGFSWFWPGSDDDSRWCRWQYLRRIDAGGPLNVSLSYWDLTVGYLGSDPGVGPPAFANGTVTLGDHLVITRGDTVASIRQTGTGVTLSEFHETESAMPQTAYFNDTGFLYRTFDGAVASLLFRTQMSGGMEMGAM